MNRLFTKTFVNPEHPKVIDVAPEEVSQLLGKVHVVDVRRPDEFVGELGHIKGAQLLTLDSLPLTISKVPSSEAVVFVCRSGGRSAKATALALENGYTNVFNMQGGMLKWNELKLETDGKTKS